MYIERLHDMRGIDILSVYISLDMISVIDERGEGLVRV